MRRTTVLAAGLTLMALGAAMVWQGAGRDAAPPAAAPATPRRTPPQPEPLAADPLAGSATPRTPPLPEPLAAPQDDRRLLGTWQDEYRGRRTMTLRDDGTATMVCELKGLNARLFTPVLNFEMQWQLEDGVMTRVIVGGEPADKVQFVINLMGARAEEKLLLLTDTELHLLDADGKTEYHWSRVESAEPFSRRPSSK